MEYAYPQNPFGYTYPGNTIMAVGAAPGRLIAASVTIPAIFLLGYLLLGQRVSMATKIGTSLAVALALAIGVYSIYPTIMGTQ
jgi:hypothetical protein